MLLTRDQIEDIYHRNGTDRLVTPPTAADLCQTALHYMDTARKLSRVIERFTAGTEAHAETRELLKCVHG